MGLQCGWSTSPRDTSRYPPRCKPDSAFKSMRIQFFLTHSVHYVLLHVFLSHAPVPQKVCQVWYFLLIVTCSAQVLILDTVLFLRSSSFLIHWQDVQFNIDLAIVLALHQKDRKIFFVWIPILTQMALAACVVVRNNFNPDSFNLQCDMRRNPSETPFIGWVEGSIQPSISLLPQTWIFLMSLVYIEQQLFSPTELYGQRLLSSGMSRTAERSSLIV